MKDKEKTKEQLIQELEQVRGRIAELKTFKTERKRAEEALRSETEKFRVLVEESPLAVSIIGKEGNYKYINPKFTEIFGYTVQQIPTGRQWFAKAYPDQLYRNQVISTWLNDLKKSRRGESRPRTFIVQCKDGSEKVIYFRPVTLEKGDQFVTYEDITERKRAEEALRETEEKYRTLFEDSRDAVYITTRDGRHVDTNESFVSLFGYTREEMTKLNAREMYANRDDRPKFQQEIEQNGSVRDHEVKLRTKDGTELDCLITATVRRDADGNILGYQGIIRDITDRNRADEELLREKEKYRILTEESPFGVSVIGEDGHYKYINRTFVEIFGYTLDDIPTGREWFAKAYPDVEYRNQVIAAWVGDLKKSSCGKVIDRTYTVMCKDGSKKMIHFRPVAMETGDQFVFYEDITERKRVEEALRESEERYRSLVENIDLGINLIDSDHNIVMVNTAQGRKFNKPIGKIIGEKCFREFEKRDAVCPDCPGVKAMASGQPAEVETEGIRDDYSRFNVRVQAFPIFRQDGTVTGYIEVVEDITERKRAEEQIFRQTAVLEAINKVFHGALTCDTDQEVARRCLEVAQELTGSKFGFVGEVNRNGRFDTIVLSYPGWDACKMPESEAANLLKDMEIRSFWGMVIRKGKSQIVNDPASDPDRCGTPKGHPPITSFLGVPLKQSGSTMGMIGLANRESGYTLANQEDVEAVSAAFVEVLSRKRAEEAQEQIRKLNTELEQRLIEVRAVNKELEAFSYSVSHDLRAPLRAIDGFSRMVLEDYADTLSDEGNRLLSIVRAETKRMGQLIDDLLTFFRLSRKEMKLSALNMKKLAESVFEELKTITPERTLQLKIKTLPSARGDRSLIRQVFANLLSNAIKFTRPRESAAIEIGGTVENNGNSYYVKDNGVGFDMKYENKLFGVFQRLHSAGEFEGTGIGLATVQRIIHRHGGRAWAEGKVNEGATFYFTLPRRGERE